HLLAFLARELRGMRLLLVCTYRPLEIESRPGLVEGLGRAHRRLHLRGRGRADIREVIQRSPGGDPAPGLLDDLRRITEGNPFFLGELVRMLEAEGGLESRDLASLPIRLPAGVRAAVH